MSSNRLCMSFQVFWSLFDSVLILIDSVDHLRVVVRDAQHLGGLMAGHPEILDQKDQLEPVFIRDALILTSAKCSLIGR